MSNNEMILAALSSMHSYRSAEREMVADMNQALRQTLAEKHDEAITLDTIQAYRRYLRIAALRKNSIVCYALGDEENRLSTQPMRRKGMKADIEFQGLANCSMASVFTLSDQRLTAFLSLMSMLWLGLSWKYFRSHRKGIKIVGSMMLDKKKQCFYDLNCLPIRMTPMQQQLMLLFFAADDYRLSKHEICDVLWPRKPDASETLYTLIRRLKPIVEGTGNLKIICDRGKDYQLQIKSADKKMG